MVLKPTNAEFRDIFDHAARRYDAVSNAYAVARRREFFISNARGRCLEVGAGTGEISKALRETGHEVVATDISPNMVMEIQKKGIDAVVCDAEKLPFPDSSFDTIIGAEMIYYLDRPSRFIQEAKRVLRPHGSLLLMSATNRAKFFDFLRGILRVLGVGGTYFDDKAHEFVEPKKLARLLEGEGFQIVYKKRIIVVPYGSLHFFNILFERIFGVCITVYAEKI